MIYKKKVVIIISALLISFCLCVGATFAFSKKTDNSKDNFGLNPKQFSKITSTQILEKLNQVSSAEFSIGNPNAKVKIFDYGSILCHHCASFFIDNIEKIQSRAQSGEIYFTHRSIPSDPLVSVYIEKIIQQLPNNERLKLVKLLYSTQESWIKYSEPPHKTLDSVKEIIAKAGIKTDIINTADKIPSEKIINEAKKTLTDLNIQATPTIFINDIKLSGYINSQTLNEIIDYQIKNHS